MHTVTSQIRSVTKAGFLLLHAYKLMTSWSWTLGYRVVRLCNLYVFNQSSIHEKTSYICTRFSLCARFVSAFLLRGCNPFTSQITLYMTSAPRCACLNSWGAPHCPSPNLKAARFESWSRADFLKFGPKFQHTSLLLKKHRQFLNI